MIQENEIKVEDYFYKETRYKMLTKSEPEHTKKLLKLAQEDIWNKWKIYKHLAEEHTNGDEKKIETYN